MALSNITSYITMLRLSLCTNASTSAVTRVLNELNDHDLHYIRVNWLASSCCSCCCKNKLANWRVSRSQSDISWQINSKYAHVAKSWLSYSYQLFQTCFVQSSVHRGLLLWLLAPQRCRNKTVPKVVWLLAR